MKRKMHLLEKVVYILLVVAIIVVRFVFWSFEEATPDDETLAAFEVYSGVRHLLSGQQMINREPLAYSLDFIWREEFKHLDCDGCFSCYRIEGGNIKRIITDDYVQATLTQWFAEPIAENTHYRHLIIEDGMAKHIRILGGAAQDFYQLCYQTEMAEVHLWMSLLYPRLLLPELSIRDIRSVETEVKDGLTTTVITLNEQALLPWVRDRLSSRTRSVFDRAANALDSFVVTIITDDVGIPQTVGFVAYYLADFYPNPYNPYRLSGTTLTVEITFNAWGDDVQIDWPL